MRLIDCFMEIFTYTRFFLAGAATAKPSYEEAVKNYCLLLERADQNSKSTGLPAATCQMAFFAVCAWVDESILCSDWPEKKTWQLSQLQRTYFNTSNAGEGFFSILGRLEETEDELREVYAYCLALGFKGQYYRPEDHARLAEIQQANLRLLLKNGNIQFPEELFPEALAAARPARRKRRFRGVWLLYAILILGPPVLFAGLFFMYRNILDQIVRTHFGAGF